MMSHPKKEEFYGNPWADATDRFARDVLLRRHGYQIARRPRGKESIWIKAGQEVSQSEALLAVQGKRRIF